MIVMINMRHIIALRIGVFFLASLSFVCLVGQFYGFWTMHFFGCWILPPATVLLAWIAYTVAGEPRTWIVQGTLGGLVAACAYDLYRLPYVLTGTPLFKVFPAFGQMLLGVPGPPFVEAPGGLAYLLGWLYHFSNGAALGIMFLAMAGQLTPRRAFWGAVGWALLVETILLCTPYATFFSLPLSAWFIFLTASAHLIFGIVLGLWCRWHVVETETPAIA
jgi:hypothetical protein